jgi:hypothetical protein
LLKLGTLVIEFYQISIWEASKCSTSYRTEMVCGVDEFQASPGLERGGFGVKAASDIVAGNPRACR